MWLPWQNQRSRTECIGQKNPKKPPSLLTKTENQRLNWRKPANRPRHQNRQTAVSKERNPKNRTKSAKPKIPTPLSSSLSSLLGFLLCASLSNKKRLVLAKHVNELMRKILEVSKTLVHVQGNTEFCSTCWRPIYKPRTWIVKRVFTFTFGKLIYSLFYCGLLTRVFQPEPDSRIFGEEGGECVGSCPPPPSHCYFFSLTVFLACPAN